MDLNIKQSVIIKVKDASNKTKIEIRVEDEKQQSDGSIALYRRTIDRRNDKYQERVIYNKTGEEKRIVTEPLSEHKVHGSNKKD